MVQNNVRRISKHLQGIFELNVGNYKNYESKKMFYKQFGLYNKPKLMVYVAKMCWLTKICHQLEVQKLDDPIAFIPY